jgi:short-subunit dehydrogenase
MQGRVVAITGAARGIGKETAAALIRKGARVAIGDIETDLATKTAAELGGNAVALPLDVTVRSSFEEFLSEAERELGPIDVLINNAGIMPVGLFSEESDETTARQVGINVNGVIFGSKLALERMLPRNTGHIVNIASQAGKIGIPGIATYSATKHAVVGLSEALRGELRDTNIEVTCVMPVLVNTELTAGLNPARGMKNADARDVADAIVDALEQPRFDVSVPPSALRIHTAVSLLPRKAREAVARAMKVDRLMFDIDSSARGAYESRIAEKPVEDAEHVER